MRYISSFILLLLIACSSPVDSVRKCADNCRYVGGTFESYSEITNTCTCVKVDSRGN